MLIKCFRFSDQTDNGGKGASEPVQRRRPDEALMSDIGQILGLFDTAGERSVDRAIAEYRAGRPVAILNGPDALMTLNVEALEQAIAEGFDAIAPGRARLLLPAARLRRLGLERQSAGSLAFPVPDAARAETLALKIDARVDAPVAPISSIDEAALELARLTLVAPAVYAIPVSGAEIPAGLAAVQASDLKAYRAAQVRSVKIVGRAPVPLKPNSWCFAAAKACAIKWRLSSASPIYRNLSPSACIRPA
jgi:GTP cyclohydrolase II